MQAAWCVLACQAWISTSQLLAPAAKTVVFVQGDVGATLASSPQREPAIPAEAVAAHMASFDQGTAQAGHHTGAVNHCGSTQNSAETSAGPGLQQGHVSAAGAGPSWGHSVLVPQNENDELNRHLAVAGQPAQQEQPAAAVSCQGQEAAAGQEEAGHPAGQQPTAAEQQGWEPALRQAESGRSASVEGRMKPMKPDPTMQQPGTAMESTAAVATFSAQQSAAEASWPSLSGNEALLPQQHSLPQHPDLTVSAATQADPDMLQQQAAAELEAQVPPKNLFGQAPIGRNTAKQAGAPQKWLTPIMHELAVPEDTTSEKLQRQQLRMGKQGEAPIPHRPRLEEQHVSAAWAAGSALVSHRQQSEDAAEAPNISAWSPEQQQKQRAAESSQHPPGTPLSSQQHQAGGSTSSQQAEAGSPAVLQPAAAPAAPVSWAQRLQSSEPAQPPKLKLKPGSPSSMSVSGPATPPTPAGMQTTSKQTQRSGRATTSAGQKVSRAANEGCTRLRSPWSHVMCVPVVLLAVGDAFVVLPVCFLKL